MSRFAAELVDDQGILRRRTVEAPDRARAVEALGVDSFRIRRLALDVETSPREPEAAAPGEPAHGPVAALGGRAPGAPARALDVGAVAAVARELARLVALGVPLSPALTAVGRATPGALGASLTAAGARAAEGTSLRRALEAAGGPLAAPPFLALLDGAQGGGDLATALSDVAGLASALEAARQRLRASLAYPLLLVTVGAAVAGVVLTLAVEPARGLEALLESQDRASPGSLLFLARAGAQPWLLGAVLATVVAAAILLRGLLLETLVPSGGAVGRLRGRLGGRALAGRLAGRARSALALRTLGALVARGVPAEAALEAASLVVAGTVSGPARETRALASGALTSSAPAGGAAATGPPGSGLTGGDLAREGAALPRILGRAGLVTRAEELLLEAASRAGPSALASALDETARERLAAFERGVERCAATVEPVLQLVVGAALVAAGAWLIPLGGALN